MNSETLELVKSAELFGQLEESDLQKIVPYLERIQVKTGSILFHQEDSDQSLYIVCRGRLSAISRSEEGTIHLGKIGPGEAVGEIQLLTGGVRTAEVEAVEDSELVKLPRTAVDTLNEADPDLISHLLTVIQRRLRHNQLAAIFCEVFGEATFDWREIEPDCKWIHLTRGEVLLREGTPSDCLWILVSGRLVVSVKDEKGKERAVGEITRGECVGEMGVITGDHRTATVHAVRESELLRIPKSTFDRIADQNPHILRAVTLRIINRLRHTTRASISNGSSAEIIAVVPAGPDVPLSEFTRKLTAALGTHGTAVHLSGELLEGLLGVPCVGQFSPDDPQTIRLSSWLEQKETQYRFMIMETDFTKSYWTRRCLQQANRIVIVGKSSSDPALGEVEMALAEEQASIAYREQVLVLLHEDGSRPPSGTRHWLSQRKVSQHHHVRWDSTGDVERLARFLGGNAVGLVLGGGGARGFAHIGAYFALREAGITIDMIGGTSMGAMMGAQCSVGWDRDTMLRNNRKGLIQGKPFKEYTLPIISLVRCRKLDHLMQEYLGADLRIEDLWMKFFCVSSDLTGNCMEIHRRGRLWKAIRASISLPGIAAPVIDGKKLLVDGGLVNNLPADVMRKYCSTIIACSVEGDSPLTFSDETHPSPWKLAWNLIFHPQKSLQAPTIGQVLMRSTFIASAVKTAESLRDADLCLQPPVQNSSMMEFEAIDDLVEIGYRHTMERIGQWQKKEDILQTAPAPAPEWGSIVL